MLSNRYFGFTRPGNFKILSALLSFLKLSQIVDFTWFVFGKFGQVIGHLE